MPHGRHTIATGSYKVPTHLWNLWRSFIFEDANGSRPNSLDLVGSAPSHNRDFTIYGTIRWRYEVLGVRSRGTVWRKPQLYVSWTKSAERNLAEKIARPATRRLKPRLRCCSFKRHCVAKQVTRVKGSIIKSAHTAKVVMFSVAHLMTYLALSASVIR